MKKIVQLSFLLAYTIGISQTQPIVYNGSFSLGPKSGSANLCSCSGWVNTDLADQGESSTQNGDEIIKFDNLESDGAYQEVAVEIESNYELTLSYNFKDLDVSTNTLEIYILKGSGYDDGYVPSYPDNTVAPNNGFGYTSVSEVVDTSNHLAFLTISNPGIGDSGTFTPVTIPFSTGVESSIAILIRSIGPYDASMHGDQGKDKGWMSGDTEVRVNDLSLVNITSTLSIRELSKTEAISVFQSIDRTMLHISTQNATLDQIVIYSAHGKKLITSASQQLNISCLPTGVYITQIKLTNGFQKSIRIIR